MRSYHHGHLRDAVLAEAVALVDAGEPLGLRELGRRLGVSHAAVHHHFPSVDGLAGELAARWFGDLDRAMAAAVEGIAAARAVERFCALGVGYVGYALAHPHRYRLQFSVRQPPSAAPSASRPVRASRGGDRDP